MKILEFVRALCFECCFECCFEFRFECYFENLFEVKSDFEARSDVKLAQLSFVVFVFE